MEPWWITIIKAAIIINVVLVLFAYLTLTERKVMARMQLRYGPNRAGPFGLLQPIADLVKLVRKESFFPANSVQALYITAPVVSTFTALAAFSVIPFGSGWTINGWHVQGVVLDVSISLILVFALGSIGPPTRSTRCSARCAPARSSSRTRSRWRSRCSASC
jgi:NADH-quinone oxidoreductase subunit H